MAYNFCITIGDNSTLFSLSGAPEKPPAPPTVEIPEDKYADILQVNRSLVVWLEKLSEDRLLHKQPDVRLAFRQIFSAPDPNNRFVRWTGLGKGGAVLAEGRQALLLKAHAALYMALADYLGSGDRYVSLGAHLVYLFAAWQAYNLLKTICADESKWSDDLRLALAGAYTRLNDMLVEPRFQMAARQMAFWAGIQDPNDPLLRHRLRRSLILIFQGNATPAVLANIGGKVIEYDKPLPAPGFFPPSRGYPEKEMLHPIFSTTSEGRRAARAMATRQLLPRYDFDSSLQIARCLKDLRETALDPWQKYRLLVGWFAIGFVTILIGTGLYNTFVTQCTNASQCITWSFSIAAGEFAIFAISAYWIFVRRFDGFILIHMAMPRLIGGIVAGFLLFVTQEDSIKLVNAFTLNRSVSPSDGPFVYAWQSGGLLVVLLWLGVLFASWVYLYNDVRPWTLDPRETRRRTFFFLLLAVMTSGLVTLFGAAIVLAAYGPSAQPWRGPILGPFGLFDLRQFLTFTPLALIAGMVSQFILEERTLPTSVWSSEQD